ncbi:hypothetical protein [Actinoplanes sp. NPDC020271]|uniref:hypothetical protein n=1 Tax=Actinoplanes sp. NPDC020271 TaxID=3363896 RepID=UPI0037A98098
MARRRFANAFLAAGMLLATAACADLAQAGAAGVGPADAVTQIAGQIADSAGLTYTAAYRLADGATAKIIQEPSRTAYRWPGGSLIVTPAATTRCAPGCVVSAPGAADLPPASGLITPAAVEAKLRAAAADPALEITERDTTIAGRHAACVKLTGAFEVCVTGDGTLAAFTGVLAGTEADLTLTALVGTADDADFQPR